MSLEFLVLSFEFVLQRMARRNMATNPHESTLIDTDFWGHRGHRGHREIVNNQIDWRLLGKFRNLQLTGTSMADRLNTGARLKSGDRTFESKF